MGRWISRMNCDELWLRGRKGGVIGKLLHKGVLGIPLESSEQGGRQTVQHFYSHSISRIKKNQGPPSRRPQTSVKKRNRFPFPINILIPPLLSYHLSPSRSQTRKRTPRTHELGIGMGVGAGGPGNPGKLGIPGNPAITVSTSALSSLSLQLKK